MQLATGERGVSSLDLGAEMGSKSSNYLGSAFYFHKQNGSWSLLIDIIIIITIVIVIYMMLHNIKTQTYFIYDRFRISYFTK